jgi:hypothetical protein
MPGTASAREMVKLAELKSGTVLLLFDELDYGRTSCWRAVATIGEGEYYAEGETAEEALQRLLGLVPRAAAESEVSTGCLVARRT